MNAQLQLALNTIIAVTGKHRFRALCDATHPEYNPAYIPIIFQMAGMPLPQEYRQFADLPAPDRQPSEPARLAKMASGQPRTPDIQVASGLTRDQAIRSMALGCPHLGPVPQQLGCGCNGMGFCQAGQSPDPRGIVGLGDCMGCVERHDWEGRPWPPEIREVPCPPASPA